MTKGVLAALWRSELHWAFKWAMLWYPSKAAAIKGEGKPFPATTTRSRLASATGHQGRERAHDDLRRLGSLGS